MGNTGSAIVGFRSGDILYHFDIDWTVQRSYDDVSEKFEYGYLWCANEDEDPTGTTGKSIMIGITREKEREERLPGLDSS